MKFNIDCARDIMLTIEEHLGYNEKWSVQQLVDFLPNYSEDELSYTCQKLYEGGYLNLCLLGNALPFMHGIANIQDLTFQGHEFLDSIRQKNVWDCIKDVSLSIGAKSLSSVAQIANAVLTEIIKQKVTKITF